MYKQISNFCTLDDRGTYHPKCFRDNFVNILKLNKDRKEFRSFLPKLYNYVTSISQDELDSYLIRTAKFSRTC